MRHDEWTIQENITQIRQLMSDQNLQLLPDYEQRLAVLRDLDFIDENSRVLLKGKVACEVCITKLLRLPFVQFELNKADLSDSFGRRARAHRAHP